MWHAKPVLLLIWLTISPGIAIWYLVSVSLSLPLSLSYTLSLCLSIHSRHVYKYHAMLLFLAPIVRIDIDTGSIWPQAIPTRIKIVGASKTCTKTMYIFVRHKRTTYTGKQRYDMCCFWGQRETQTQWERERDFMYSKGAHKVSDGVKNRRTAI